MTRAVDDVVGARPLAAVRPGYPHPQAGDEAMNRSGAHD
jgi:hypothetical protein